MPSCSVGSSPKCWLPLSVIVPLPLTAPLAVKLPEPEYEASLTMCSVIEALPDSVGLPLLSSLSVQFFLNDPATTEIYTLALHAALPIFVEADPGTKKLMP